MRASSRVVTLAACALFLGAQSGCWTYYPIDMAETSRPVASLDDFESALGSFVLALGLLIGITLRVAWDSRLAGYLE